MEVIKEKKHIMQTIYDIEWVCPYCGCKNTKYHWKNVWASRWRCWKCKKYSLIKKKVA